MALRIGFLVNPIAGMGGKVGLKGTDAAAEQARQRGAAPVAPERAGRFLERLRELLDAGALADEPAWLTAAGPMGADLLGAGLGEVEVVHRPAHPSTAQDTKAAARAMAQRGAQVVVVVGGDGTVRDAVEALQGKVPVVGVPSGVKMHSAVFGVSPEAAAELLAFFEQGLARVVEGEVLDVDEEAARRGEWKVKLFALAPTLDEPQLRQAGKFEVEEVSDREQREELADHVAELAAKHPESLFLLGPGGTLATVGERLGLRKTLLGFDAWRAGQPVGTDLDEEALLALLDRWPDAWLLLTPIGAQGFVLGRGNQQASPAVVRRIARDRLLLLATPQKLRATPALRVDTGDPELDALFRARGHLPVLVGMRTSRMVPVA